MHHNLYQILAQSQISSYMQGSLHKPIWDSYPKALQIDKTGQVILV